MTLPPAEVMQIEDEPGGVLICRMVCALVAGAVFALAYWIGDCNG